MGRLSASTVMEHMIAVMRRVSELAPADGSQGRPVSVMRIARDLGLEPARVRDSIRMLNECGATLADSADGAAFAPFVDYDEAHDLVTPLRLNLALDRTIGLTPREARALLTMFDLARIGEDDPLARKIRGAIPRLTASVVDGIEAREVSESPAVLLAVVDAIRERQTLVISYRGAQDDHPRERYIRPLRLTYDVDATSWYAYCWCLDAEGYRNFRLDRIATAGVAPEEAAAGERDAADAPATLGASGARLATAGDGSSGDGRGDGPGGGTSGDGRGDGASGDGSMTPLQESLRSAQVAVLIVHDPHGVELSGDWRGLVRVEKPVEQDAARLTDDDRRRGGYVASIPWLDHSPWLARKVVASLGAVEVARPVKLREDVRGLATSLLEQVERNYPAMTDGRQA
ncbi:WYL domain-containing protein [bacterium]|nr:WYL domain-containing protein [bacterium]